MVPCPSPVGVAALPWNRWQVWRRIRILGDVALSNQPWHSSAFGEMCKNARQRALRGWSPSDAPIVHDTAITRAQSDFVAIASAPRAIDIVPPATIDPAHVPEPAVSEKLLSARATNPATGTEIGTEADIDINCHCMRGVRRPAGAISKASATPSDARIMRYIYSSYLAWYH